ncbi:MAG: hypothetical protein ACI8XO_001688 [Verrucomicrobiales bacterium]|jgi:hypothetical protein
MKKLLFSAFLTAASVGFNSTADAVIIATTGAGEFSGTQGQNGWDYGYWDVTNDASPGTYTHTSDFTPFIGGAASGAWSDTNYWNGSKWDFNPLGASNGNPPWTEITATSMHPNNLANGGTHASVLRYTVEAAPGDTLSIMGFFNNVSTNGDGTTGRILLNGAEQYAILTDGTTDNLGGGVTINGVSTGDVIDFMIDVGPADSDGSDGTNYGFTIDRIPEPSAFALLLGSFALALRRRR